MESFWATMKTERIDGQVYSTCAEARSARFWHSAVFYNRTRLHGAPGLYSPVDSEHHLNENIINPALRLFLRTGSPALCVEVGMVEDERFPSSSGLSR